MKEIKRIISLNFNLKIVKALKKYFIKFRKNLLVTLIDINSPVGVQSSCNYYRVNFRQQQRIFSLLASASYFQLVSLTFFIFIYLNNCYREVFCVYARILHIPSEGVGHLDLNFKIFFKLYLKWIKF